MKYRDMKHPVILTDVDDCIFSWRDPFEKWILSQPERFTPKGRFEEFYNIELWLGMEYDDTRIIIEEFNSHPEYWPHFEPSHDSDVYINRLHEEGFKFVAITACSNSKWSYKHRWDNLQKHYGDAFDTLHCTELGGSKEPFLERYRPSYWVEDKGSNAVLGAELGHTSFLLDFEHNREITDSRVIRVSCWEEIYKHIQDFELLRTPKG